MPHLPQPARGRVVTVSRVIRRAAKSPLPEVQAPALKSTARETAVVQETELLASEAET